MSAAGYNWARGLATGGLIGLIGGAATLAVAYFDRGILPYVLQAAVIATVLGGWRAARPEAPGR